ncbi:MAG TPA: HAMP domain-containing sensor histidine kinase [Archangium sp.]|uniref:sensor histidine kinase n=1 Tax=Archangium sp. TaxID=1872627 RepID=UPI002E31D8BB|nr:HAMP domain-containing sensor histidine kinase [Archangium sp.]HEX5752916.1 HAMP domain-containing sensor histidine kinase [Archangium sp.]
MNAYYARLLGLSREDREQFVSSLSHDLRTPLTAAKMSAQLIPRQPHLPDKVYSLAARVRQNIDRADQMITDLLDANRIRAGQGLPLEVSAEELSRVHGERFHLRSEKRMEGRWDARALRRLVENLCGNAIQSMAAVMAVCASGACMMALGVPARKQDEGQEAPAASAA